MRKIAYKHKLVTLINILVFIYIIFVLIDYTNPEIDYLVSLSWDKNGILLSTSLTLVYTIYLIIQILKINHFLSGKRVIDQKLYNWNYLKAMTCALIKIAPLVIIYSIFELEAIFATKNFSMKLPYHVTLLVLISAAIILSIICLVLFTVFLFLIKINYIQIDNVNNSFFNELYDTFETSISFVAVQTTLSYVLTETNKIQSFMKNTNEVINLKIKFISSEKLNNNKKAKAPPNVFKQIQA